MGDAGFDLDRTTERAWSRFQSLLADRVAELGDEDVLVVCAESAVGTDAQGSAPYVQFCGWGDSSVRVEVASNEYLAEEVRLDDAATAVIEGLGWSAPTERRDQEEPGDGSANFFLDTGRDQADRLAVMTCLVLREVFGVPHPAFLSADSLEDDTGPQLGIPSVTDRVAEPAVEVPAVFPRDRDHLRELVDQALMPYFGAVPTRDEDDDIPVASGSALVFVRLLDELLVVELFCCLVHGVQDRERAAFEVAVLNRDQAFLKFVLVEQAVMAYAYVPAYPFAPEHLRTMLSVMSSSVDRLDDDLAHRVGGLRAFETGEDEVDAGAHTGAGPSQPGSDAEPVHPAMLTLLELEADAPGSTTAELAASVCGMDRDVLLELIGWNSAEEIAWRHARDQALLEGDTEEAELCEAATEQSEQMVDVLRRALRLVVEHQLGRDLPGSR